MTHGPNSERPDMAPESKVSAGDYNEVILTRGLIDAMDDTQKLFEGDTDLSEMIEDFAAQLTVRCNAIEAGES